MRVFIIFLLIVAIVLVLNNRAYRSSDTYEYELTQLLGANVFPSAASQTLALTPVEISQLPVTSIASPIQSQVTDMATEIAKYTSNASNVSNVSNLLVPKPGAKSIL